MNKKEIKLHRKDNTTWMVRGSWCPQTFHELLTVKSVGEAWVEQTPGKIQLEGRKPCILVALICWHYSIEGQG